MALVDQRPQHFEARLVLSSGNESHFCVTSLWKLLAPVHGHLWITTQLLLVLKRAIQPLAPSRNANVTVPFSNSKSGRHRIPGPFQHRNWGGEWHALNIHKPVPGSCRPKKFQQAKHKLTLVTVCFLVNQQIVLSPGEKMKNENT